MKQKKYLKHQFILLSPLLILFYPYVSYSATITQNWISKDTSIATITIQANGEVKLPKKGGGSVVIRCKGSIFCTVDIADFKDKKGTITYDTNLSSLQTLSGTIDEGTGRFVITTTGTLIGLFSKSIVSANLRESTGLTATIGLPGDQISQGGTVDFSTRWYSNDVIGMNPDTQEKVVLGDFFLNSINPLTAFEYNIVDSNIPLLQASLTIGQQYQFSTGLNVSGEVTKNLSTVPLPGALPLFILGLISLLRLTDRKPA